MAVAAGEMSPIIGTMELPKRLPGLRGATLLFALYSVVWIALEGSLIRAALLGSSASLLAWIYLLQRWLGGRTLSLPLWLALAAALGVLAGFSSAALTLVAMALKTGLHAHGPEFTAQQVDWVVAQIPWWTSSGLLAGLGLGLIAVVSSRR